MSRRVPTMLYMTIIKLPARYEEAAFESYIREKNDKRDSATESFKDCFKDYEMR